MTNGLKQVLNKNYFKLLFPIFKLNHYNKIQSNNMNNETFSRDDIVIVDVNPIKSYDNNNVDNNNDNNNNTTLTTKTKKSTEAKEITPETIAAAMTKMNLANNQKKNEEKTSPP